MLHLFAVFAIGFAVAGTILLIYRLRGLKPPRYLVPLAAGLAMLGYAVWSDYSWASRTIAELPQHVKVVKRIATPSAFKPWTYLVPEVDRFVALDTSETRKNERLPGMVLAELILVARRDATVTTRQLFDCPKARRSDIVESQAFTDEGMPVNPDWVSIDPEDELYRAVCGAA